MKATTTTLTEPSLNGKARNYQARLEDYEKQARATLNSLMSGDAEVALTRCLRMLAAMAKDAVAAKPGRTPRLMPSDQKCVQSIYDSLGCPSEAYKEELRQQWGAHNGLVVSNSHDWLRLIGKCSGKLYLSQLPGCDHTDFWRLPKDKFPCVMTTQPYDLDDGTVAMMADKARDYGLTFAISAGGSFWFPGHTLLVVWHSADFWLSDLKGKQRLSEVARRRVTTTSTLPEKSGDPA